MKMKTMLFGVALLGSVAFAGNLQAQEVNLKAAFFLAGQSTTRQAFDRFVAFVNKHGAGKIKIGSVKGPEAVPPRQMGNALKNGIVDIAGFPPSYIANLVPGVQGLSASTVSVTEQRKNGTYDVLTRIFKERANAYPLAQLNDAGKFYIFMNKRIKSVDDLKGMRMRTSNTYRAFLQAAGALPVNTNIGEIYTALQRGVVDGYVNVPSTAVDFGWAKVTKYRVEPGFYSVTNIILVNRKTWDALNADQKAVLTAAGKEYEAAISDWVRQGEAAAMKKLADEGIKTIKLSDAEGAKLTKLAYTASWNEIVKRAPDFGPQLRKLLYH